MAFKLLLECDKKLRIINGVKEIKNLIEGVAYKYGIIMPDKNHHEALENHANKNGASLISNQLSKGKGCFLIN